MDELLLTLEKQSKEPLKSYCHCALSSLFHIYLSIHSFHFISFLSFFSFTLCYLTGCTESPSHRDREHQIAEVEAGHHRAHHRLHAENKIGKNYLLEAYLNGLHEVDGGDGAGIGSDIDGDARIDTNCGEKSADNKNSSSNDNVIGIATATAAATNDIDKDDEEINKVIATPGNSRGNSDSGVNTTEEVTTSPDVCLSTSPLTNGSSSSSTDNNNDAMTTATTTKAMTAVTKTNNKNVAAATKIMDTKSLKEIYKRLTSAATATAKTKKSKKEKKQAKSKSSDMLNAREAKLIMEHESRKEFCEKIAKSGTDNPTCSDKSASSTAAAAMALFESGDKTTRKVLNVDEHLAGQIELLEKVIAINKHIQREEELLVRLNAKIRKYEVDDPNLTESEMRKVLDQINTNIDASGTELLKTEHELNASSQMLMTKSQMVKQLSEELEALEIDEELGGGGKQNLIQVPSHQIQIHSSSTENEQQATQNAGAVVHSQQQQHQAPAALIHSPQETNQVPTSASASLSIPCSSSSGGIMKTGTLPKLISSVLKKNTQNTHAKNTYCGTIPKIQQRTMCNQMMLQPPLQLPPPQPSTASSSYAQHSTNIERPPLPPTSIPSNAVFVAKNQSFLVPDHVILSQAPLFFQKDTFNGTFMQSTDQRNANFTNGGGSSSNSSTITTTSSGCSSTSSGNNNNNYSNRTISNLTSSNNINLNNVNINPSIVNCAAKVGPKKLINGFYKDPDSDTGLSSLGGDDALLHIGTLV